MPHVAEWRIRESSVSPDNGGSESIIRLSELLHKGARRTGCPNLRPSLFGGTSAVWLFVFQAGFCLGAVVTPGADPIELQLIKMEKKIAAGATFFQTQAVFDAEAFARFMDKAKPFGVPVMAGIILLKSPGMARFMNKNVAGVHVPDTLIEEMSSTGAWRRSTIPLLVLPQ